MIGWAPLTAERTTMTDHRDTIEGIAAEIAQERRRQITQHGYTPELDRTQGVGHLISEATA